MAVPVSQRETVCLETFSFSASASWDRPWDFRSAAIFSDSFIVRSPFDLMISL